MKKFLKPVQTGRLFFNNKSINIVKASNNKIYVRLIDIPPAINLTSAGLYYYLRSHDDLSAPTKIKMPTYQNGEVQEQKVNHLEVSDVIKTLERRLSGQVTERRSAHSRKFLNWLENQDFTHYDDSNKTKPVEKDVDKDDVKYEQLTSDDVVSVSTAKLDEPVCVSVKDDVICSRNAQNDESKKLAINISVLGKSILKLGLEW